MPYPIGNNVFIPEATGQIIDPLEMDPVLADSLFGQSLMDYLRERAKNPRPVMKYVQIVKDKENE